MRRRAFLHHRLLALPLLLFELRVLHVVVLDGCATLFLAHLLARLRQLLAVTLTVLRQLLGHLRALLLLARTSAVDAIVHGGLLEEPPVVVLRGGCVGGLGVLYRATHPSRQPGHACSPLRTCGPLTHDGRPPCAVVDGIQRLGLAVLTLHLRLRVELLDVALPLEGELRRGLWRALLDLAREVALVL